MSNRNLTEFTRSQGLLPSSQFGVLQRCSKSLRRSPTVWKTSSSLGTIVPPAVAQKNPGSSESQGGGGLQLLPGAIGFRLDFVAGELESSWW